jgi:hypothetical protein
VFEGFGSGTVITILGLLILTAALLRTGLIDLTGRAIPPFSSIPARIPITCCSSS